MDTNKHGLEAPSERKIIAQGKRSAALGKRPTKYLSLSLPNEERAGARS
jgi:hypothetical protein